MCQAYVDWDDVQERAMVYAWVALTLTEMGICLEGNVDDTPLEGLTGIENHTSGLYIQYY